MAAVAEIVPGWRARVLLRACKRAVESERPAVCSSGEIHLRVVGSFQFMMSLISACQTLRHICRKARSVDQALMGQLVEGLLWADNNHRTDLSAQVNARPRI